MVSSKGKGKKAASTTTIRSSSKSSGSSLNNYKKKQDTEDTGTSKRKAPPRSRPRPKTKERNVMRKIDYVGKHHAYHLGSDDLGTGLGYPTVKITDDVHFQSAAEKETVRLRVRAERDRWHADRYDELVLPNGDMRLDGQWRRNIGRQADFGGPSSGNDSVRGEHQNRPKRQRSDASGPSKRKHGK
jgi:hypothetical protein